MDLRTAEMVRYASNAWRALKISFADEIGNIAEAPGLDGQTAMEIPCSDREIAMSPAFLRPGFAFGRSCLAKDERALRLDAKAAGLGTTVLTALLGANAPQIGRAEGMDRASRRAIWFVRAAQPDRERRRRALLAADARPAHAFFVAITYRIDTEVSAAVYRSVVAAAARTSGGATIIASVVDGADARPAETLARAVEAGSGGVRPVTDRIPDTGKREALARSREALRAGCRARATCRCWSTGTPDVPEDIAHRAVPAFCDPRAGALTTDGAADISEPDLFRDWSRQPIAAPGVRCAAARVASLETGLPHAPSLGRLVAGVMWM